jgi:hypothetical protein
MREHQPTTTVAIVDANKVVESALAQLLEGEGYSHEGGTPGRGSREERAVAYPLRAPGGGDRGYAGGTPPTRLHLDRSDPDSLTLLTSSDSCFSSRGTTQQTMEREAQEE